MSKAQPPTTGIKAASSDRRKSTAFREHVKRVITGGCRIHTSNIIRIVRHVRLPHAYRVRARDPTEILRKKVSRDMADVADEAEYIADPHRRVAIRRLDRSV